jgi:hypothetical protein
MSFTRVRHRGGSTAMMLLAVACAAPASRPTGAPAPARAAVGTNPSTGGSASDTLSAGLVPAGYGSLRQDDIAIKLQSTVLQVRLIPLDESVIRTLSPDSYSALRQIAESRKDQIARYAMLHNLRERRVWYVTFFGLAPEARFTPTDVTVTAAGRELRPLEIIPLTSGFGEQRLGIRDTQSALYLFDDGLDTDQPVTVTVGVVQNTDWQSILRTIERERAVIRSRASSAKNP